MNGCLVKHPRSRAFVRSARVLIGTGRENPQRLIQNEATTNMDKDKAEDNQTESGSQSQSNIAMVTEQGITNDGNPEARAGETGQGADAPKKKGILGRLREHPEDHVKMSLLFDVLLIAVTTIYAFFALLQWIALNRQAAAIESQSTALNRQIDEMRKSNELTAKQLEATDRPWVVVSSIKPVSQLWFDADGRGLNLQLNLVIKNIGRSVAVRISINAELVVGYGDTIARQQAICQNTDSPFQFRLFPADTFSTFPYRPFYWISMKEIEAALARSKLPQENSFQLFLVGCINYQVSGQTSFHHTGFIYDITRKIPGPRRYTLIEIGRDTPASLLEITDISGHGVPTN